MIHAPTTKRPASTRATAGAALRVFFALWPDPPVRDALAALARDAAAQAQGRASAAEDLHLTLVFLGDVAPSRVALLQAIGRHVCAAVPAFTLSLDCTGMFRGSGIAWAGASATPPELAGLVGRLREALVAEGFALERRGFRPHVTLARRCRKPGGIRIAEPVAWIAAGMALNASELRSDRSRYRELASWPLGPRERGDPRQPSTGNG
jgi:2'-5' RNA ligase